MAFAGVPGNALNFACRQILSRKLNRKQVFPSKKGFPPDYRGLMELMGFNFWKMRDFEYSEDVTLKILEAWEVQPDATLDKLFGYLEDMDRKDVIEELIPLLEFVTYDAYISYAEDDMDLVANFAQKLESPEYGLKLFIAARDVLAGYPEMRNNFEFLRNRFRYVIIFLTPNFMRSPEVEFITNFAANLSIEQRQKILIPVIMTPCEIPPVLNYISKINFTEELKNDLAWKKLYSVFNK